MKEIINLASTLAHDGDEIITIQFPKEKTVNEYNKFKIINNEAVHEKIFKNKHEENNFDSKFNNIAQKNGFYIIRFNNRKYMDFQYCEHYNIEIGAVARSYLMIYVMYNIKPNRPEDKAELEISINGEKVTNTLVYACYENNIDKIKERIKTAKRSDLNKIYDFNSPLMFCAKNDNLEAFKMLIDAGANIKQRYCNETVLQYAINHSKAITLYIYDTFPEYFKKRALKEGLGLTLFCHDVEILNLIKSCGANLEGKNNAFPNLHNFADFNNVEGIKFLIDNGVNPLMLNKWKQTAYDRAKNSGKKDAMEYFEKYIQKIIDSVSRYAEMDEEIITILIKKINTCCYFIITKFKIKNNEVIYITTPYKYIGNKTETIRTMDKILYDTADEGFYVIRFNNKKCLDFKYYPKYNIELSFYDNTLSFLMIYITYNLFPKNQDEKKILETSIKKEEIKDTLVYACYENDIYKIEKYLKNASRRDLGKAFNNNTPLMFCAENDNLEAFKMLIDAGANIKQVHNFGCALETAINYSKSITMYIYEYFYEYFKKKVTKNGFSFAVNCHDVSIFQLFKDVGINLNNNQPSTLLTFISYDNVEGVRFLIENGVSPLIEDSHGNKTAYMIAKEYKCQNVMKYLEQFNI